MGATKIEWAEHTWNPIRGCSRVSPGCKNCYAEQMAARFSGVRAGADRGFGQHEEDEPSPFTGFAERKNGQAHWTGKVELIPHMLEIPLKRKKPTVYFVNSMSDLFHEKLPDEAIDQVFAAMALCPQHRFLILTKRAKRMWEWFDNRDREDFISQQVEALNWVPGVAWNAKDTPLLEHWPLPNVWLGVSVENQQYADERIPELLRTPAAVRFVSYEAALGPADFHEIDTGGRAYFDCLRGLPYVGAEEYEGKKIDWIIAGGESGPGARPAHPDWFRSVRDQCQAAGVPFFFKQWGEYLPDTDWAARVVRSWRKETRSATGMIKVDKKVAGRLLDGREWNEMPQNAATGRGA